MAGAASTSAAPGKIDPRYGLLLQHMKQFHDHFRLELRQIQSTLAGLERSLSPETACSSVGTKYDRMIQQLLSQVAQLCQHLDMHHRIEEAHIFPVLAKRIPDFATGAAHISEHEDMHKALEAIEHLARDIVLTMRGNAKGQKATYFDIDVFRQHLNRLQGTLLPHLEAEEKSLRAENLIKHGLTLPELNRVMV